ncbi:ribosomal protein L7/L12 [Chamaesiphon polymorphus]|uniref:Large ribosomal subunit protein bL12 C-terminal domain-containing protein n=1 Tax=Chamaesiphon polymorphus CCALA 037 TaxID=2107692 RepID=A0A2T1GK40_9CYAN|nr:ribosomal protein L7/L12 [Chamaesiphon polymorphus]PSB58183.1 hypothetical protein C7B77_05760 [Chamaesiphon polymorphus CCALA 037]
MCESDGFGLIITDVGESRAKVFYIVRQLTAKSPKDVKAILDNPDEVIIASGNKRKIGGIASDLEKVGAKIRII